MVLILESIVGGRDGSFNAAFFHVWEKKPNLEAQRRGVIALVPVS